MLLKEHRFKVVAGTETHLFTVEELVTGLAGWADKFRLRLPATSSSEARTFYGASCYETAEKAAAFLAKNVATDWSQRPSDSRRQTPAEES